MKFRRLSAMLLSGAMVLGLLAGCGTEKSAAPQSSAEAAAVSEPEDELFIPEIPQLSSDAEASVETGPSYHLPISEEPLTYSIWMTYAPFAADLVDTETMEGMLVLDTLQEVTNIHFDVTAANGAAEQDNFNLMIAGGDYCDILSSMNYYATGLEGAVEEGIIQDLAQVIPEKCPTYWSYLSSNVSTLMQAYTDSGYMPSLCVLTPEVGQEVVGPVIRGDWLEGFGMDTPKTLEDLYAYLEKANAEKGAIMELNATDGLVADIAYGLGLSFGDVNSTGGAFRVVDGEVQSSYTLPEFQDYLRFMHKLFENDLISQDFYSDTSEDLSSKARLDFGSGTNSLVSVAANNTSDIMMNVTDDAFQMTVIPYVSVDGQTESHVGPASLADTMKDNDVWAFSAECDNIEPLLEMVEYLFSDEGFLLTNYGVEGQTYEMVDGKPQYTDLITNNPDGLSYFFASYVYATNAASGFFPYLNDMSRTFYDFNDNQWQVYEDLKNLSDCAWNYPAYAKLTTEETTEYTSIASDMDTYLDSRVLEFITGAADVETEFDAFVEKLYDMGLQDMIDLKQAAYDRAAKRVEALGL